LHAIAFTGVPLAFALALGAALTVAACGERPLSFRHAGRPPASSPNLSASQVQLLVVAAAQAANVDTMVIAVSDRAGRSWRLQKTFSVRNHTRNFGAAVDANELAVSLARTAAFFSNDQAPSPRAACDS